MSLDHGLLKLLISLLPFRAHRPEISNKPFSIYLNSFLAPRLGGETKEYEELSTIT